MALGTKERGRRTSSTAMACLSCQMDLNTMAASKTAFDQGEVSSLTITPRSLMRVNLSITCNTAPALSTHQTVPNTLASGDTTR